jgi:hypothetical protein
MKESALSQLFIAWLYVVPLGHASQEYFLHNGFAAGHASHVLDTVLKYWS